MVRICLCCMAIIALECGLSTYTARAHSTSAVYYLDHTLVQ